MALELLVLWWQTVAQVGVVKVLTFLANKQSFLFSNNFATKSRRVLQMIRKRQINV